MRASVTLPFPASRATHSPGHMAPLPSVKPAQLPEGVFLKPSSLLLDAPLTGNPASEGGMLLVLVFRDGFSV